MFKITFKKSAVKELEKLPKKIIVLITNSIFSLVEVPRPSGCKKLKGSSTDLWRIRVGDYRVIYSIDEEIKIIDIKKVGHRKDIYESL
jgi:mRNA interferase RelE/StbE